MRKGFLIVLAVVLVAALAAPAMAGMDVSGFVRVKGYMSNFKNGATAPVLKEDAPTFSYVEERFRAKFSFGEENVKAVWFVETDFGAWGDSAGSSIPANTTGGAGRNSGGALGGDRINLETKNIYIWFKLPNTSLDFTVGLQNRTDAYAGLLYGGSDQAGIFMTGKMEPVSYTLGWAKLYENNNYKTDDLTLYIAEATFAPTKELKLGANFYFIQDDTQNEATPVGSFTLPYNATAGLLNKKRIYTPGINATFIAGPVTLSGFFLYQFGEVEFLNPGAPKVDIEGYAVDLRGDMNIGPGKAFLEGIYVSGSDGGGSPGEGYKSIFTLNDLNSSPGGNSFFGRTDMMILLGNPDDINTNSALIDAAAVPGSSAFGSCQTSPGNCGRGMWHIAAGYTQKLGDKLTGKVGVGYLAASDSLKVADVNRAGKDMGTEVNANLNYNIMKGLDFGVYAAYAWLGDFYKPKNSSSPNPTTGQTVDPDDVYDIHFRLNYAF